MTIDEKRLQGQLASLERQEQVLRQNLAECQGAQRQCKHFLGLLQRDADAAKQVKAGDEAAASTNGQTQ